MNQPHENGVAAATTGSLNKEFPASIVVFLVALPLCMGIAIASGVPVAAGLITGIVGGLVVGSLAGCPLQVSGPAAGLTVIVYEIVQQQGFEMLGIVVLLAGLLQLVAGIFGLGQWFRAVSPAVIKGMLAGIGVLIFASQFHVMVDDKPKGSGLDNLLTLPEAVQKGLAWPNLASSEKREFRRDSIREIGELHRRQAAIAELVAERLPDHAPLEKLEHETPEQIAAEAKALLALLPDQHKLTEEVDRVVAELQKFEREANDGERSKRIVAACAPVLANVHEADEGLESGRVRSALKIQTAAVTALADLSASMKNHALAAQIGILTIAVILLWQAFSPKKLKFVPAPLLAVLVSAVVATLVAMPVLYVEVPDQLWGELHFPTLTILSDAPWAAIVRSAIVVAVVASAETLLCATAVDQMHQGPRTRYNKELRAQGIGNMVCGVFGALPMTGVIVRSTANLQAGGTTRLPAILHGVWLLVFVVFLAFLLRLIPTSALAAMLVYTGYKLINPKSIGQLKKYGKGEVAIYLATVITIVVADLLTGVIAGMVLAAAKLLYTFSHLEVELKIGNNNTPSELRLEGVATFVRLPRLATKLEQVPAGAELHVDLNELNYVDHACLDLLTNWARQHEVTGGKLVMDWDALHDRFNMNQKPTTESADSGNPGTA